jgi:hypothetical protein
LIEGKTFFAKKIFSRQIFLLQNTKEKFGGKKFTLQKSEFYFAKERGPRLNNEKNCHFFKNPIFVINIIKSMFFLSLPKNISIQSILINPFVR